MIADSLKNKTIEWCDRVSKGDFLSIPIRLLNRLTDIWGEDANEFRYAAVLRFLRPVGYCSLISVCAMQPLGQSGGKMYRKRRMRFQVCMVT